MVALRLVIDTNVLISSALKPDGLQRTTVLLAMSRPARWYVSEPILQEYSDVLSRKELGVRKGLRSQLMQLIRNRSYLVKPKQTLSVANDPDDNIFIECADAARADYLITGNLKHYPKFWKNTKIISTREFVQIVSPHLLG